MSREPKPGDRIACVDGRLFRVTSLHTDDSGERIALAVKEPPDDCGIYTFTVSDLTAHGVQ